MAAYSSVVWAGLRRGRCVCRVLGGGVHSRSEDITFGLRSYADDVIVTRIENNMLSLALRIRPSIDVTHFAVRVSPRIAALSTRTSLTIDPSAVDEILKPWERILAGDACCITALMQHVDADTSGPAADLLFAQPFIDLDEWRDIPVRHRYVHGVFAGTQTRFSFYFPPPDQYQGRFFHYITPVPDSETLSQGATGEDDRIGFSITSGAYFVETNGGGRAGIGHPGSAVDPSIGAYRANAAAAQYSRIVATRFFGPHQAYGYSFGGSGGAYRTIGGLENTSGVWDGAVPFVLGSPMAIPNVFCVRMHAMRVLKDKFPHIIDALEPGGSGDMYAGLDEEQLDALREVTRMGFPPRAWFGYKTMGVHGFSAVYPGIVMADPQYFEYDFWHEKGYLGANPPPSLKRARVRQPSHITAIHADGTLPVTVRLADLLPDIDFLGGDLVILTGAAAGKTLPLARITGDTVVLGDVDPQVLAEIQPGDGVRVDNSNFLAAQTYHRHQLPAGDEYPVWDQFRNTDGTPRYPQRARLLGPLFTASAAGAVPTGTFNGKMILVESLWDREAFPWQADWYQARVMAQRGGDIEDCFRLWYVDHALHAEREDPTRTVNYTGVLQQALRDLSAWVEQGTPPPQTTRYRIDDGQVIVARAAADRKGVQPVVLLRVNGAERADIPVGTEVVLNATVDVPPGAGVVVRAEWDLEGRGDFAVAESFGPGRAAPSVTLVARHVFQTPGVYFPTLRVTSQRDGDAVTPYARIQNLGRVRVVVS